MEHRRIDTHQHILPPAYYTWLEDRGYFGGKVNPRWSKDDALDLMGDLGIETSIVSVSRPGVYVPDDAATTVHMARLVNEFCADLVRSDPGRFGFFAQLPLPHVDAALKEVAYAFDELGADGVVLHTNIAGQYVGCQEWDPVMSELDRRGATVFLHPTNPVSEPLEDVAPGACDFLLDTVRAAVNLTRKGAVRRFTATKFILSHGGGFLPYAAYRLATLTPGSGPEAPADPEAFVADLRTFYLDTALASSEFGLPSLLAFADPKRLLYGSDWPHAARDGRRDKLFTASFDAYPDLSPELRTAINRENALDLFPRLREPAALVGAE